MSASKYGGGATILVRSEPDAMLDAAEGGYVYWHSPDVVQRVPALGGNAQHLYSFAASASATITNVAITPSALYLTTSANVLWKLALDGTTLGNEPGALAARLSPTALYLEATGPWATTYAMPDGSDFRLAEGQTMALDTRHGRPMLFVLADHRLIRIDSSRATVLATQQDTGGRVALAGDEVYWTNPQSGAVRTTSVYGGGIDNVATGQPQPTAIAADNDGVFWTTATQVMRATPR
jgi:hypothetical protein